MAETKDLTVHRSADLVNAGFSATDPSKVPHMQAGLLEWARAKLELQRTEQSSLEEAQRIAEENGFRRHAFVNAVAKAQKTTVFYEKLVAAMEVGYCLFPTTDVDIFAVRTERVNAPRQQLDAPYNHDPGNREVQSQALPAGRGRYVNDQPVVYYSYRTQKNEKTGQDERIKFFYSGELRNEIDFPFELAKPEIMECTAQAMRLKIFDEFGVIPPTRANADPIIVGRIVSPKSTGWSNKMANRRRISFLIAWFVDTKDL